MEYQFLHMLTQVISAKDQRQYWFPGCYYQYVPVAKFVEAFRSFRHGYRLSRDLATPFDKRRNHPSVLSKSSYGLNRIQLLKIVFSWQTLLMKRNSFLYIFKYIQVKSFPKSQTS